MFRELKLIINILPKWVLVFTFVTIILTGLFCSGINEMDFGTMSFHFIISAHAFPLIFLLKSFNFIYSLPVKRSKVFNSFLLLGLITTLGIILIAVLIQFIFGDGTIVKILPFLFISLFVSLLVYPFFLIFPKFPIGLVFLGLFFMKLDLKSQLSTIEWNWYLLFPLTSLVLLFPLKHIYIKREVHR